MKRIIVLVVIAFSIIFSGNLSAKKLKEAEVPAVVVKKFKSMHGSADKIEYNIKEENGKDMYRIRFEEEEYDYEYFFEKDGTIYRMDGEMPINELPERIKKIIDKKFEGEQIVEVEKIIRNYDEKGYQIKLVKGNKETKVEFDSKDRVVEINMKFKY